MNLRFPFRNKCCIALAVAVSALAGCAEPQPQNITDACQIFEERKHWYAAADRSQRRWRIPMEVTLAFIHQESSFQAKAKPPRRKLLGFIPWFRPSSAYGYAQALDQSWKEYKEQTGRWFVRRSKFEDAVDFIGWYNHKSVRELGLRHSDARSLYLAYHEGRGGYRRKTYAGKAWLLQVADKVAGWSNTYRGQLQNCKLHLKRPWYSRLLSSASRGKDATPALALPALAAASSRESSGRLAKRRTSTRMFIRRG